MRPNAISGPAFATTNLPNRGDLGVEVFRSVVNRWYANRGELLDECFVGEASEFGSFAETHCAILEEFDGECNVYA